MELSLEAAAFFCPGTFGSIHIFGAAQYQLLHMIPVSYTHLLALGADPTALKEGVERLRHIEQHNSDTMRKLLQAP